MCNCMYHLQRVLYIHVGCVLMCKRKSPCTMVILCSAKDGCVILHHLVHCCLCISRNATSAEACIALLVLVHFGLIQSSPWLIADVVVFIMGYSQLICTLS